MTPNRGDYGLWMSCSTTAAAVASAPNASRTCRGCGQSLTPAPCKTVADPRPRLTGRQPAGGERRGTRFRRALASRRSWWHRMRQQTPFHVAPSVDAVHTRTQSYWSRKRAKMSKQVDSQQFSHIECSRNDVVAEVLPALPTTATLSLEARHSDGHPRRATRRLPRRGRRVGRDARPGSGPLCITLIDVQFPRKSQLAPHSSLRQLAENGTAISRGVGHCSIQAALRMNVGMSAA